MGIKFNPDKVTIVWAVTYGGVLGALMRILGYKWNHILVFVVPTGSSVPSYTYESNWRGVDGHPFHMWADLAEECDFYEPVRPLTRDETIEVLAFADGNVGKLYGLWDWVRLVWRIGRELWDRKDPNQFMAFLRPGETCISFAHRCGAYVDRPVSEWDLAGLPDDIMVSPHYRRVGEWCRGSGPQTVNNKNALWSYI